MAPDRVPDGSGRMGMGQHGLISVIGYYFVGLAAGFCVWHLFGSRLEKVGTSLIRCMLYLALSIGLHFVSKKIPAETAAGGIGISYLYFAANILKVMFAGFVLADYSRQYRRERAAKTVPAGTAGQNDPVAGADKE